MRKCFICKRKGHLKRDCRIWLTRMAELKKSEKGHIAKTAREEEDGTTDNEVAFVVCKSDMSTNAWYIDSGATSHMTNNEHFFTSFDDTKENNISLANWQQMLSAGIGDGYKCCQVEEKTSRIPVKNVLFVPSLDSNLLSVKQVAKQTNTLTFKEDTCTITKSNAVIAKATIKGDFYRLDCTETASVAKQVQHENCIHLWYRRLGHRDPEAVKKLCAKQLAVGINIDTCTAVVKCDSCLKGKMTRKSFPKASSHRANQPLDLVHSDICGPMNTLTPGQKKYFLTFIDDHSRYTTVYLLHSKDEVSMKLEEYLKFVQNKFERRVKALRTDNGTEYTSKQTQAIMKREGIEFLTTVPYNPQLNSVVERKNRTLCESARSMLFDAGLPTKYWGEAVMTACYVQNRLPTKATDKTPFELWNGSKPDIKHLRVFGCKAYVHVPDKKRTKWDARATVGVF